MGLRSLGLLVRGQSLRLGRTKSWTALSSLNRRNPDSAGSFHKHEDCAALKFNDVGAYTGNKVPLISIVEGYLK